MTLLNKSTTLHFRKSVNGQDLLIAMFLSILNRGRDFANVLDRPTSLTVHRSWASNIPHRFWTFHDRFWAFLVIKSLKRSKTAKNDHGTFRNGQKRSCKRSCKRPGTVNAERSETPIGNVLAETNSRKPRSPFKIERNSVNKVNETIFFGKINLVFKRAKI